MNRLFEKFMFWFTWKLPRVIVYYCVVRAVASATTGEFSHLSPSEISAIDTLNAWEKKKGGDKSFKKGKK